MKKMKKPKKKKKFKNQKRKQKEGNLPDFLFFSSRARAPHPFNLILIK